MNNKKIKIEIDGMTCPNCEKHVAKELQNIDAKKVVVSHKNKAAIFEIGENISEEVVKRAVKTAGYKPGKVMSKEIEKKGFFGKLLW